MEQNIFKRPRNVRDTAEAPEFLNPAEGPKVERYFVGYSGRMIRPNNFKVYWLTSG